MSAFDKAVTEGKRPYDLGDILEDFFGVGHPLTRVSARLCEDADCGGDRTWEECPQLRDGEPEKTGRHCPLDNEDED